MSAVNLTDVVTKLTGKGLPANVVVRAILGEIELRVHPQAEVLHASTRALG